MQSASDARIFAALDKWIRLRHGRILAWLDEMEGSTGRVQTPVLPTCLNDKYTWRKIFDRNPLFRIASDKLATKDWVAEQGYKIASARTLWQGNRPADIPEALRLKPGYLKAAHGSGRNIALGPDAPPRDEMVAKAKRFLKQGYGRGAGQWGYYRVPRRLLIEEDLAGAAPAADIKCFVFGGQTQFVAHIMPQPEGGYRADVFDLHDGKLVRSSRQFKPEYPLLEQPLPKTIEPALALAHEIGAQFDHMRVDFLTDGTSLWMGELTVYPRGGVQRDFGTDPDHPANMAWDLRQSWFMQTPQKGWREVYRRALRRAMDAADENERPAQHGQASAGSQNMST
ncbi:ATP-grasp fold amidoligase family protein [Oceanicola sp. D3]|uniref:ATP-grasp fold amidoligase family protein n=1 Tax=Oceanicola sp. D3 TaxID=2587163 RepID=UPI001AEF9033|nr:ATP-grasp fold amidoligase family protein [Oceanicola sp. D3]